MILEKLNEMVNEQLGAKKTIAPDMDIVKDIGLDSLDIVELLMNVEEEWGIVLEDDDIESVKTVGDVVKLIEAKTK